MTCIFTVDDALAAQREAYNFQQQQSQQGVGSSATLNGAAHKRPMIQPQANGLMGGMGGGARHPSRNGLTIEHILKRLSGELQKSRETSAELGSVANAMGEIENVMGGGQPPSLLPYPHSLPAVRSQQQQQQQHGQQSQPQHSESEISSLALAHCKALQKELVDTRMALHTQIDKIHALELLYRDQEDTKRDVNTLRDLIEEQRDRSRRQDDDDDDDRRSVHTVVPHELESVPEEDETEAEESEEERNARREELGRPRTPEPSSLGMHDDDEEHERGRVPSQPPGIPDEWGRRLTTLSDQLEAALELSRNLQAQQTVAQQTIEALENKVAALESMVITTQASQAAEEEKRAESLNVREKAQQESMVSMFAEFKKTIEDRWGNVKSEWQAEHDRIGKRQEEWESRAKTLEDGVSKASGKFELGIANLTSQLTNMRTNGNIIPGKHHNGLVTPPSPRSLSDADSDSDQPLKNALKGRKRSRSRNQNGRLTKPSRSRSPATSTSATLVDGMSSTNGTESSVASVASLHSRRSSTDSPNDSRSTAAPLGLDMANLERYPPTPESSVHMDELNRAGDAKNSQHVQVRIFWPLLVYLLCSTIFITRLTSATSSLLQVSSY